MFFSYVSVLTLAKREAHTRLIRGDLVQIQLKEDDYEEIICFQDRIKCVWSVHKALRKDLLDDCFCISTVLHKQLDGVRPWQSKEFLQTGDGS